MTAPRDRDAGGSRGDASERIVEAALGELVRCGAGSLAMHDVADRAGVSKGLIHYHYHDKNALLARAVLRLAERISARTRGALSVATTATAVRALAEWIVREIELGEWRALLSLAEWNAENVRAAAAEALAERRAGMQATLERLFELLGVRPRIALAPLLDLTLAVVNGLTVESGRDGDPSAAVDALVLALYRLTD